MTDFHDEALGGVVRNLRKQKGLTQEELGRAAGYGAGAGVSISRLEGGLLRPGPDRLRRIASALGLEPDELEALAAESQRQDDRSSDQGGLARRNGSRSAREIKVRAARVQAEIDERTKTLSDLAAAFNEQHERARDKFFMPFATLASRIENAPEVAETSLEVPDEDDAGESQPDTAARIRLTSNANTFGQAIAASAGGAAAGAALGGVAAYGTFVAAASFGTASTGVAISGLSGIAATNATLALLGGGTLAAGGAGVAGGTMLLAGIVAAPAAVLFAGGLLWMAKRSRDQQRELARQLDEAEDQLAATRPGYEALAELLPRAIDALDYIATHAGHAVNRWAGQLDPGPLRWEDLSEFARTRYLEFVEIAAAQLTIVTINVQGLLTTSGEDQRKLIELTDQELRQSQRAITQHV